MQPEDIDDDIKLHRIISHVFFAEKCVYCSHWLLFRPSLNVFDNLSTGANSMNKLLIGILVLTAMTVGLSATETEGEVTEGFKFLAFGDMPYIERDYRLLRKAKVDLAEAQEYFPFAVFYGDIKKGSAKKCRTDLYIKNRKLVLDITAKPVFATLGDNDWTDCKKEYDKLTEIRDLLYQGSYLPETRVPAGQDWHIIRDNPEFPELVRWRYGEVQFTSLHIVGTENGRDGIKGTAEAVALAAVDKRDAANLRMLNDSFVAAKTAEAQALVVMIHADVTQDTKFLNDGSCAPGQTEATDCNPFKSFENELKTLTKNFGKPVLLIHGSKNEICVEKKFLNSEKLTRYNGPGDYETYLSWVTVNKGAAGVTFTFEIFNKLTSRKPKPIGTC